MDVFVARHAIFNRDLSLFAYELLFRACNRDVANVRDDTESTLQVLANTLLSSGLQSISSNAPVFINFGQELLTSGWTSLFPPSSAVIEILETVQPDSQVVAACLELRKMGYYLALDDVVGSPRDAMLAHLTNFVKVDFRATTRSQQRQLAQSLKRTGKKLVAEKVETHEDFKFALNAGYDFFQGFFFAKPTLMQGRQVPNSKMGAIRLLKELQAPDLNYASIENIVKSDISLSYKLLRYVNSALFAHKSEISSIQHALVVLGEVGIRRFLTLASLPGLATGTSRELIRHALVRAHFCKLLALKAEPAHSEEAFLIGLFSMLDALVDLPLAQVLSELGLSKLIVDALVDRGCQTGAARIYRAVSAYEAGNWTEVENELSPYALGQTAAMDAYLQSIAWASQAYDGMELKDEVRPDALAELGIEHTSTESLLAMERALGSNVPAFVDPVLSR